MPDPYPPLETIDPPFPQVATAISPAEALWLREHARGRHVVEVGAWVGFSACLFAQVAELVVSVDWHRGDSAHPDARTLAEYMANLERERALEKVVPVVARSELALPLLAERWFDFAFVDGDHTYEQVCEDARLARALLRPLSVLAFHDYHVGCEGVDRALDELYGQKLRRGPDSIAWVVV
jgi:predicted O-methyltransferase YrrM